MPVDASPQPSGDAGAISRTNVPPTPCVKPEELWFEAPNVLIDAAPYTIGWQRWRENEGGPSYVTVRRSAFGSLKIVDRYPMTDEGWARAWRAFRKLDPATAKRVLPVLARRAEAASRFAEREKLDARSLAYLPEVVFIGGYVAGAELAAGQVYELRFLEDRLSIFRLGSLEPVTEFSYADVQAVEVAGPGRVRKWSPGQEAMLTAAFGLSGALMAYASTRIKTFVRIQTADSEQFFLHTTLLPDDLRILLSRGLGAIREAKATTDSRVSDRLAGPASLVDDLSRLAGLLDSGVLSREEFELLKAKLITER